MIFNFMEPDRVWFSTSWSSYHTYHEIMRVPPQLPSGGATWLWSWPVPPGRWPWKGADFFCGRDGYTLKNMPLPSGKQPHNSHSYRTSACDSWETHTIYLDIGPFSMANCSSHYQSPIIWKAELCMVLVAWGSEELSQTITGHLETVLGEWVNIYGPQI